MATVYGLHEVELRPEVDPEEFERYFAEEIAEQPLLPGWRAALLRADRGRRAGRYLVVFEVEGVEERDRFFSAEDTESEELRRYLAENPETAAAWEKAWSFTVSDEATDYVVVAP